LRDESEQTPLHIAARRDASLDILRKLVDCGVDLEARTHHYSRQSCTGVAVSCCRVDALRLFLLAGATVDDEDPVGGILLHKTVASRSRKLASMCLTLLLAARADVAARDGFGRTACLVAALEQSEPMPFVHAMLAVGADLDAADNNGETPRLCLTKRRLSVEPAQVELARREITKMRLDFVRYRASEVCIGLRPLQLDALQVCEILRHACGPLARVIAFHQWWKIATTVKHFRL
jgi:ankyrin repeat protein